MGGPARGELEDRRSAHRAGPHRSSSAGASSIPGVKTSGPSSNSLPSVCGVQTISSFLQRLRIGVARRACRSCGRTPCAASARRGCARPAAGCGRRCICARTAARPRRPGPTAWPRTWKRRGKGLSIGLEGLARGDAPERGEVVEPAVVERRAVGDERQRPHRPVGVAVLLDLASRPPTAARGSRRRRRRGDDAGLLEHRQRQHRALVGGQAP